MGELTSYRGYTIICTERDFIVEAPNGDTRRYPSMSSVRAWIRKHEKQSRARI